MENAGAYRVGLAALGHRVQHAGELGQQVVEYIDAKKGKTEWKNVVPSTDAEVLIPLSQGGPTSHDEYRQLKNRLLSLKPFGQTPLYFAILEAARAFPPYDNSGIPRQIIVLSDGVDQTYDLINNTTFLRSADTPNQKDGAYFAQLVRDGVKTSVMNGIQVQVIGFDMKNNNTSSTDDQKRALHGTFDARLAQLELIAKASGGQVVYPSSMDELKKHLDTIINTESFRVTADAGPLDSGPLNMGKTWSPDPDSFQPGFYTVSLTKAEVNERLYLEGGEEVVLEFDQDRTLHFLRSDNLEPPITRQLHSLGSGKVVGDYWIGLLHLDTHRPETPLRFSFTNEDDRSFSYRPQRLAVEAIPDGIPDQVPYFVQDYNYEFDKQSPVVEFSEIHLLPGKYTLKLWVLPFSEKPAAVDQAFELGENKSITRKYEDVDVMIVQNDQSIEAKLSGSDPDKLRTMLVDLLIWRNGQWQRTDNKSIKSIVRSFQTDGTLVVHDFTLAGDLGSGRIAVGLSRLHSVFADENLIQFPYSSEPR